MYRTKMAKRCSKRRGARMRRRTRRGGERLHLGYGVAAGAGGGSRKKMMRTRRRTRRGGGGACDGGGCVLPVME